MGKTGEAGFHSKLLLLLSSAGLAGLMLLSSRGGYLSRFGLRFATILILAGALASVVSATTTSKKKSTHKNSTVSQEHTTKAHAKEARKVGSTAHAKSARTSHASKSKHAKKTVKSSWKSHGQHGIDSDRTRQIQEALIRQNYLSGEADGNWDSRTQDAMRRYQEDHGWQSKVLPDSRALIKLGLGPDHSGVLNPETAAVSPYATGTPSATPAAATTNGPVVTSVRDQN
jgi:peptidoglycan hydrolase-like protein with peptidoglycan-binding domain